MTFPLDKKDALGEVWGMGRRVSGALVLASRSPRRQELLQAAGVDFSVAHPEVDEVMLAGEDPAEMVQRLALAKALDVVGLCPNAWVLGADTVVVLNREVLGKPRNEVEARHMLEKLVGHEHQVVTGFALVVPGGQAKHLQAVLTRVRLRQASKTEVLEYVRTGEPLDKAGAYAIQGRGGHLVASLSGSYTNVIGLPLEEVLEVLAAFGLYSGDAV